MNFIVIIFWIILLISFILYILSCIIEKRNKQFYADNLAFLLVIIAFILNMVDLIIIIIFWNDFIL